MGGYELDGAGVRRLAYYFEQRIGQHLRDCRKRGSFAMYAFGILGDGERKSVEPMAARACADPNRARAMHEKLLHFVGRSRWSDRAVRREAALYAIEALATRESRVVVSEEREPQWLVTEWPDQDDRPSKFVLCSLDGRLAKKQIVRLLKERWRVERAYEDLKGELGLDHFEGRSYPGWHHHISVVICCYAFIVAERARHFPPSRRRSSPAYADPFAA